MLWNCHLSNCHTIKSLWRDLPALFSSPHGICSCPALQTDPLSRYCSLHRTSNHTPVEAGMLMTLNHYSDTSSGGVHRQFKSNLLFYDWGRTTMVQWSWKALRRSVWLTGKGYHCHSSGKGGVCSWSQIGSPLLPCWFWHKLITDFDYLIWITWACLSPPTGTFLLSAPNPSVLQSQLSSVTVISVSVAGVNCPQTL